MYEQLLKMLNSFTNVDVKSMNSYKAMNILRDQLINVYEIPEDEAKSVAIGADITLPEYLDEQQLQELSLALATIYSNMREAFLDDGYDIKDIIEVVGKKLMVNLE